MTCGSSGSGPECVENSLDVQTKFKRNRRVHIKGQPASLMQLYLADLPVTSDLFTVYKHEPEAEFTTAAELTFPVQQQLRFCRR